MNEVERQVLEGQRIDALRKRDELDVVIKYFDSILGARPDDAVPAGEPATSPAAGIQDPLSPVNEGEFYGMSATKASKVVLERVGKSRPLKTAEIFEAIRKGGVAFKSKEGLYKSLDRDPTFRKIPPGRWGLDAWYGGTRPTGKRVDRADSGDGGDAPTRSAPIDDSDADQQEASAPTPSPNGHGTTDPVSVQV